MRLTTQDGIGIEYAVTGSGHPILCLPGLTRNASDFEDFIAAFPKEAMIITMTSRGRLPSDFDPDFSHYNVYHEGRDAIALLDHLKIDKALWLGTSRGGLITMALAPKYLDRMAGAVFNDIGPELELEGLYRIIGYLGIEPEFETVEDAAFAMQRDIGDQFSDLDFRDWQKLAARWYNFEGGTSKLRYDPKLRDAVLEGGIEVDLWEGFHALRARPFGLVWGENSDLLINNQVLKMQENAPELKVARVPNRGHVPFLNEPEALALIGEIFDASFAS